MYYRIPIEQIIVNPLKILWVHISGTYFQTHTNHWPYYLSLALCQNHYPITCYDWVLPILPKSCSTEKIFPALGYDCNITCNFQIISCSVVWILKYLATSSPRTWKYMIVFHTIIHFYMYLYVKPVKNYLPCCSQGIEIQSTLNWPNF